MKLGMYSVELRRPTVAGLFAAMQGYGFSEVQFDFASVCDAEMPAEIDPSLLREIDTQAAAHGVEIVALNGTFNMIHPDPALRADGVRRFEVMAAACAPLHCDFVTLCTGTRDPGNMWRWHDDNLLPDAWLDLTASMAACLEIAERYDLLLGIECEASNCINTPDRARQLLDQFDSPRLKIIMDVANLFQRGDARPERVRPIIDHAFDLLCDDIHLAHGKDIKAGDGLAFTHAGNGIVDFDYFLDALATCGYTGGMLLHGIKDEAYFPESVAHVRGVQAARQGRPA